MNTALATRPAVPAERAPVTRAIPDARVPTDLEVVEPQGLPVETETDFAIGVFSILAEADLELRQTQREEFVVFNWTVGDAMTEPCRSEFGALEAALEALP